MKARYESRCVLCGSMIAVGDEIVRDNNEHRHRSFVHSSCKPAAGVRHRARFRVKVVKGDDKGYIAAGTCHKQYVRESSARTFAQSLRDLGARHVEVVPL